MLRSQIFFVVVLTFFLVVSAEVDRNIYGNRLRAKRAINPFMDSIGKRAGDSGLFRLDSMKHSFDGLTGESLAKRNSVMYVPVYLDE